jgi:ribosomal protein S18 acetylase RimI-like enzyme
MSFTSAAPAGHVLRSPVETDAASIAVLCASIEAALYGESETAESEVRFTWAWPRFDLARDAWLVATEDRVVAYAWVWGPRLRVPRVEFDSTLQLAIEPGADVVAAALLERMESRVREMAREQGIAEPPAIVLTASSLDERKRDALLARGYQRGRTFFHMERGLDATFEAQRWPAGTEVAVFRPGVDDAEVHDTVNDAFAEHYRWMREPLEEWRALRHNEFAPELTFIVRREGRAVAASVNYRSRNDGYIGMLGVRRAWRRRGLATALLLHSFAAFQRAGVTRALLGVDSENADDAVRIYEAVGMRVTRRNEFYSRVLD